MLHRLRPLALLLAMVVPVSAAMALKLHPVPPPPLPPLKVMSFNVRTPADTEPGKRWADRRDAMVHMIAEQRPAVMGTQELVQEQASYLAAHLPDYRWFGEGRRGGSSDEHMGVFYDTKAVALKQSGNFWLSDTPNVPGSISWNHLYPRMVTWGLFRRLDGGQPFYLLNTHLPYRSEDESARVRGAQAILAFIATLPADVPVVLTGDFNSEPGSPAYRTFTTVLQDTRAQAADPQGPRLTFHDFTGTATSELDWILVRGFKVRAFATLDARVDGVLPSDHFPLVTVLD